MAKSSSRKSLKSLFSKSEASPDESVEKDVDKNEGQRKRFHFLKFKKKSKNGSAYETPDNNQRVVSDVEPSNTAEDGEASSDNIVSNSKRSSLYSTAPRSKGKELSYSELDLRKPKRFSTFSFGQKRRKKKDEERISKSTFGLHSPGIEEQNEGKELSYSELDLRKPKRFSTFSFGQKRRKKKDEERISKSTFGLHSPGIEEQNETPLHVRQMELDQAMFSMSQPELDISDAFDIPSPPPVATNQSKSSFNLPNQSQSSVAINTQPEAKEPLTKCSDLFDVHKEPPKAPIAIIPELQLENTASSEKENIPVHDNSSKSNSNSSAHMTHTETTSAVDNQTVHILPASLPPVRLDTSDEKEANAAAVDSVSRNNNPCDNEILQQVNTKTENSLTESITVTSPHHQHDAPFIADSTGPNGKPPLANVDFKIDTTFTESAPLLHTDNSALNENSASMHEEASMSLTERSIPETATTTSAVSGEKSGCPVIQDAAYGELYETLFPQNFTSEVMSSLSNLPPKIHTEITQINTKSEPIVLKTLNECHTETNVIFSRLSTSREFDPTVCRMDEAVGGYTNINASFSERKVLSSSESSRFTSYQTSTASECQRDSEIHDRYLLSPLSSGSEPANSDNIPYSKLNPSLSEVKSDSFCFIQDTVRSVPVVQNSTHPVSDYVTSQGTDIQVTDCKRRVILVKELVTDEASPDPGCPSPVPEKMSAVKGLEIKIETTESLSAPSGQMDGYDGPLSPTYLSAGSDDASVTEIYYSAEEDNAEESMDEEMYTVHEREEISVEDGLKAVVSLCGASPQKGETAERGMSKRGEVELSVVILKMQNDGGKMGNEEQKEDVSYLSEVQQQLSGQNSDTGTSEFPVSNDAKTQQKEVATPAYVQVKVDGRLGRKEELPATPVQQVNTLMECDFPPPSSKQHGQGEGSKGNWTEGLETEDHPYEEKQLPSQDVQYLAYKDIRRSENIHSSHTRKEDIITSTFREKEMQVSLTTKADTSKESTKVNSYANTSAVTDTPGGVEVVTGTLTHSAELQSDATEAEHNRTPQSSEWVDTITQSTNGTRTVQKQVAVELSAPDTDTHCPDIEAAHTHSERLEHLAGAQPDLNQG
ncbi:uncharacterized protein LOC123976765 [Micropterus dolomieu]|uniref:uncharacterized protein LOC123976765 n=1 Tax=Micropterus dolomieu TaxID=147949 RepID=UPI001E8D9C0C|nr:uncharacterized protein LOC123976765 [Micropterus dolomieu]